MSKSFSAPAFGRGVRASLVINLVVAGFGVLYGVGAVQVGIPGWLAVAASLIVLSGAAQFATVALVGAGAGPGALLIAGIGLALRHLPMAATIRRLVPAARLRKRLILAYVLTDETFGLTVAAAEKGEPHPDDFMLGANATLVTGWVLGSIVGVVFGDLVDLDAVQAGVLFPLLFLGLAAQRIEGRRDLVTALVAAVAAVVAVLVVPEAWRITAAAFAAALIVAVPAGEGDE